jgi:4-hydroxybenzoate polyprenyltransferase
MKSVVAFLRLIRLPNIFTTISNVWAGAFIAANGIPETNKMILASIASAGLYAGGIAFNDYCDRNYDSLHRPERPIPSGAIRPVSAVIIIIILWLLGLASGFAVSFCVGLISAGIIASAFLYDVYLKKYLVTAALFMGICRGLNWLLGLNAGGKISGGLYFLPLIILVYIAGLTSLARSEDKIIWIKKIVMVGIIVIPLVDAVVVASFGLFWQSLIVLGLIVPALVFGKSFEMT